MNNRFKLVSLLLFTIIFTACSKSEDSSPTGCTLESLKEVFGGATQASFYYTYDDQGRVTRIDFDSKPSAKYELYTYSNDKIVVSGTALGNGTAVYKLDANRRVVKYGPTAFSYNSEGYLSKVVDVNGPFSTTINYNYQNNNMLCVDHLMNVTGQPSFTNAVLYDFDLTQSSSSVPPGDPIDFTATYPRVLGKYFGKGSANLVKKETIKMANFPDEIRTHTYTRDSKGNITLVKTATAGGTGEKDLTYNCK